MFFLSCFTSGLARRLDSGSDPDGGAATSAMTITPASGGTTTSTNILWLPSVVLPPGTGPHLSRNDPPNSREVGFGTASSSRRTVAAALLRRASREGCTLLLGTRLVDEVGPVVV